MVHPPQTNVKDRDPTFRDQKCLGRQTLGQQVICPISLANLHIILKIILEDYSHAPQPWTLICQGVDIPIVDMPTR